MNEAFYAGHEFKWMNNFLKAVPENKWFRKSIAMCIACCIHHQFVYKKQTTFKLSHKALASFGINRKCLRRYLSIFRQAGLIEFVIKDNKSPIVTLLLLPYNYYNINKKNIIKYTVPLSQNGQDPVPKRTAGLSQNGQVMTEDSSAREPTHLPSKETHLPSKGGSK